MSDVEYYADLLGWLSCIEVIEVYRHDGEAFIAVQEGMNLSHSIRIPDEWVETLETAAADRRWDWQGNPR